MTPDHLIAIGNDMRARLLSGGAPTHMEPVLRDGWATLYRWRQMGSRLWRIRTPRHCPQDLDLLTQPKVRACCYQLDARRWIVLAHHESAEPIGLGSEGTPWAYPEAMITWCCDMEGADGVDTGCLNLAHARTWRETWIAPGQSSDLDRGTQSALHADDLAGAEMRLARALPWWLEARR